MKEQKLFLETKSLLSNEDKPLFIAAEIMRALYFEILLKIENATLMSSIIMFVSPPLKISIASKLGGNCEIQMQFDVVIVGGGLSGLAASIQLSQENLKINLIEKFLFRWKSSIIY